MRKMLPENISVFNLDVDFEPILANFRPISAFIAPTQVQERTTSQLR